MKAKIVPPGPEIPKPSSVTPISSSEIGVVLLYPVNFMPDVNALLV
jgi:hypothetical protein